jgi:UDP-N-acetylmuramate--alanine ligase
MMSEHNHMSLLLQKIRQGTAADVRAYFIGIGGIGMSALARYLKSKGVVVSGYDRTETALTQQLVQEGIHIHYEDDLSMADTRTDFVVYTPAIPKANQAYNYFIEQGHTILKRSELLGLITANTFNICVAGTHGKTTTSTMIAHLLRHSGVGCNAFLGGIASNYDTNFWASDNPVVVVEADEYDRSFLQLHPDIAVITAMDPDHLDIYSDAETFQNAFVAFSKQLKADGMLLTRKGINDGTNFDAPVWLTYANNDQEASCSAHHIRIEKGSYQFEVSVNDKELGTFTLNMGGWHNVENALAAITVVHHMGVDVQKIQEALAAFRGVKRRFEYVIKEANQVMIDDYAHHPQELEALIKSVKALYPDKKCVIAFQPHLFSRTRDFAQGFAEALSLADEILLLPIYPARELPIPGVNSELLMSMMDANKTTCCSKESLLSWIEDKKNKNDISLLVTAGAGDIDMLVGPIKKILS